MKYYYIMYGYENEPDDVLIADDYEFKNIDRYVFEEGKSVTWDKSNAMYYSQGSVAEDYLAQVHPSARVVSEKIKRILEQDLKVKGLEFYPVPIKPKKEGYQEIHGYYVLNVLNLIPEALDREESDITVIEADGIRVETVKFYTLKKDKISDYDVFMIGDGSVFVSNRVKQAFDKAGVTGIAYGNIWLS